MPKKRKDEDSDFLPGFTRRMRDYDPSRDNRNISKQLQMLKGNIMENFKSVHVLRKCDFKVFEDKY